MGREPGQTFILHFQQDSLHAPGLFSSRYSFPVKSRGKDPAAGGAEQITGRAQETEQKFCADQTHGHIFYLPSQYHKVEHSSLSLGKEARRGSNASAALRQANAKSW